MSRAPQEIEDAERAADETLAAAEAAKQAAEKKNGKKPRKDRGTRRVVLPAWLVKQLEAAASEAGVVSIADLLDEWNAAMTQEEVITLPPAVLARLAPAAAGSGRSISELLGDIAGYLCDLLDGKLLTASPRTGDQTREQAPPPSRPANVWSIPSLEELLVDAFRARLRPQEPTS
jgi:hypothetical protein